MVNHLGVVYHTWLLFPYLIAILDTTDSKVTTEGLIPTKALLLQNERSERGSSS